jgi:hypothetical protein
MVLVIRIIKIVRSEVFERQRYRIVLIVSMALAGPVLSIVRHVVHPFVIMFVSAAVLAYMVKIWIDHCDNNSANADLD